MESDVVVLALGALAQPHRLTAFRHLVVAGPAGLTPGVLTERLGIPAATLSFHLKELLHAGLVSQSRDGRHLIYRARCDCMQSLLAFLTENCCGGESCATTTALSSLQPNCDCEEPV
jgi:DNA-binding transcriptional ArsR family regulator